MSEEEPNIIVREIRGKKKVGFRGMEYIEKPESEMRELVEEKGDAIIEFHDTEEDLTGPDKYWNYGRLVEEYTDEGLNEELRELLNYSTLDIAQSYDLRLFHNFYKMFPEGEYDPDYPWAIYREMVVDKRFEESQDVFKRLQEQMDDEATPRTYEYRAFLKCDTYDLPSILEALYGLGSNQTSGLDVGKAAEGARRVRIMAGEDPSDVSEDRVEKIIEERGLEED